MVFALSLFSHHTWFSAIAISLIVLLWQSVSCREAKWENLICWGRAVMCFLKGLMYLVWINMLITRFGGYCLWYEYWWQNQAWDKTDLAQQYRETGEGPSVRYEMEAPFCFTVHAYFPCCFFLWVILTCFESCTMWLPVFGGCASNRS